MIIGLTGGTGFIGNCLLKEHGDGHEFRVLYSNEHAQNMINEPNIKYVHSDYSFESVIGAFEGCEAVVHLGGLLTNKEREQSIANYYPNIDSSEVVFKAAVKLGITNIVNASSRLVYDPKLPSPHKENEPLSPVNKYGVAKLAVEGLANIYNREHGLAIKTLRFAQVFGKGGREGYLMSVFREKCEKGEPIEVFDKQGKELLYVKDAAKAIISALMAKEDKGVFNIGSGTFNTHREIAEVFKTVYNNGAEIIDTSSTSEVTKADYLDVSKAAEILGYTADYDLCSAIDDMRKEYLK